MRFEFFIFFPSITINFIKLFLFLKKKLPKKQDLVLFCHFGKKQEEVYKKLFTLEEFQIINRKDEQCDCK